MKLSKTQVKLLKEIQRKLKRGDITAVAEMTGVTKEYAGMILNPNLEFYRLDVVQAAIKVIADREKEIAEEESLNQQLLETLNAVA